MKTLEVITTIKDGKPPKGYPSNTPVKTVRCKLVDGTSTIAVFEASTRSGKRKKQSGCMRQAPRCCRS